MKKKKQDISVRFMINDRAENYHLEQIVADPRMWSINRFHTPAEYKLIDT